MTINAANLVFRLSGGAANANVDASLGGIKSSVLMASQSAAALATITGVTINYAGGLSVGVNNNIRLTVAGAVKSLSIKDYLDGSYGPAVDVSAGGTFFLSGSNRGCVAVTVAAGSLPATTLTDNLVVSNIKNNLFDDVLKVDALNGADNYRCIYLHNTSGDEAFLQVGIYGYGASGNPAAAGDLFWVGADPAGAGDGSTTGVAATIANELTAPAGVTFSSPVLAAPLILGAIQPGESRAIWLKRAVPPALYAATPDDYVSFGLKLIF